MNKVIAGILMPYLKALPFADLVGGLAQVITTGSRAENQAGIRRFPASYQVADKVLALNQYQDLTPNDSLKSVMFIEGYDCSVTGRERGLINFKSVVRVVGWVNSRKVNETPVSSLMQVLKAIPEGPLNASGLQRLTIKSGKIFDDSRVFSRYTFDEAARQYLMLPFFGFAVELQVTFSVNPDPTCQ